MTKISQLPQDTAPTVSDSIPTLDAETTTTKRTLISDLITLIFGNVPANSSLSTGWITGGALPTAVVANANRSYSLTYASSIASIRSIGMRNRYTRTTAASVLCASLNGTTQYFSRTSASLTGVTFTDNMTGLSWIKLTSYAAGGIISRWNGTNGWIFSVNSSGQLFIQYGTGQRTGTSYRVVPLNKWVQVAATMSNSGAATTMYMDGELVASVLGGAGGTITQAGNLEVGSYNASAFFPGKIAHAAVFSAVLSQATINSYKSQGYVGNETALVSAYSLNNSLNDLSSNGNNLTANGSATTTNADSSFGNSGLSTTLEYGITMAISSDGLTETVQVPEGCALPTNSGGISAVAYSGIKVPYLFPSQRGKWRIEALLRSAVATAANTQSTWLPFNWALTVPIGDWTLGDKRYMYAIRAASGQVDLRGTISTTTNSETDVRFTVVSGVHDVFEHRMTTTTSDSVSLSAATAYNALIWTDSASITSMQILGSFGLCSIWAKNAHI